MTIKEKILQSSYYSHMKAADELSKVGENERADEIIREANKLSIDLFEERQRNGK